MRRHVRDRRSPWTASALALGMLALAGCLEPLQAPPSAAAVPAADAETPEPTPGPADPGPPAEPPPRAPQRPTHTPPAVVSLPVDLPDPPPGLEESLRGAVTTRPRALVAETAEREALLVDPTDRRDVEKVHAAVILGHAGGPRSLPALHHALVLDRSPRVRAAAAAALGRLGAPASLVPLWDALRDRTLEVRVAALHALGALGDARAVPPLRSVAQNGRGPEATAALSALVRLGATEALALLDPGPPDRHADPGAGWTPALGGTFHVDATSGDDGGDGSAGAPFRTLGRAVLALRPGAGDVLLATAGDQHVPFREEVDLLPQAGGTPDSPTVLRAWPGHPRPVLDGALAGDPTAPGMRIGLHIGADHVRVEGFVVRRYADSGIDLSGSTGSALVDCLAEDNGRHGLFVYYAPRSLVVRSAARRSAAQGISIRSSPGTLVLGGESTDNGIDGLLLLQDTDDVVVHGFTARGNQRGVAVTTGSNRARIVDSDLDGNGQAVVIEPDSGAVVIRSGTPVQE